MTMIDTSERAERRRVQTEGVKVLEASGALDELYSMIDAGEIELDGRDGLIQQMIKAGLERGLQAELTSHVGYEKGSAEASQHGNSRNGTSAKTVSTIAGDVELAIPRDREGSFTPRLVPKGSRRLGGLDEMIISLYAGGMTVRDIEYHLATTIGTEVSRETISKITDEVMDEVLAWQQRPLDSFYPVIYLDALMVKVRDGAHVTNKASSYRGRGRYGRDQARPRDLDPSGGGRQILGRGVCPALEPWRA
jgi:transposase-like protein